MTFIASRTPPVPKRRGARTCVSSACGPNVALASWPVFEKAATSLLTFFTFPKAQWNTLRTTNTIERLYEEFRRRVKTQGSLPTEDAAVVLLFSLVASGQIRLRRIDGWQKIATCSGSRPREPHDETASPQLLPCFGLESRGEDFGATLHGFRRYQGEADRLVEL
jgi:hypothetical protein